MTGDDGVVPDVGGYAATRVDQERCVRAMVLACGRAVCTAAPVHTVPARPGRDDVDPLLSGVDRIVVLGDDADLAAVVLRLLRTERLDIAVGHATTEAAIATALPRPPQPA